MYFGTTLGPRWDSLGLHENMNAIQINNNCVGPGGTFKHINTQSVLSKILSKQRDNNLSSGTQENI